MGVYIQKAKLCICWKLESSIYNISKAEFIAWRIDKGKGVVIALINATEPVRINCKVGI